jgi:hypothetical protein
LLDSVGGKAVVGVGLIRQISEMHTAMLPASPRFVACGSHGKVGHELQLSTAAERRMGLHMAFVRKALGLGPQAHVVARLSAL